MSAFAILLLIIYTLACCVLIFIILIQSGDKGGGLSSLGSSSQGLSDALGATGAEKTLNKITTAAATIFIILAVILSYMLSGSGTAKGVLADQAPVAPLSSPMTPGGPPPIAPGASAPVGGGTIPANVDLNTQGNVQMSIPPQQPPAAPQGEALPVNPATAPPAAPPASSPAAPAPAK